MTSDLPARPGESLIILGAGAVGCAAALTFARRGLRVTVIDRGPIGGGASHGNAGGVVPSASILAQPGLPWKVPGMLLDRTGPLTIRPSRLLGSLPWFLRFLSECRFSRMEASSIALYALTGQAAPAWKDLTRGTAASDWLKDVGWMKAFSTDKGLKEYQFEIDILDRRGAPYHKLNADEMRQMEPNLAPIFVGGVWQPDGLFAANPRRLVEAVATEAQAQGVTFLTESAQDLSLDGQGRPVLTTDRGEHRPDRLMLCAGAFSRPFAKQVGANPLLEAERGYHAMFDTPERGLNRPVFWMENSLVLCPMAHGTRMTTQSEFGGTMGEPRYARLERMVHKAGEMLPGLDITIKDRWMGHRPSTPDSLPYLGPSPASDRVFFNFGHNHLGLTMAAISARISAEAWMGDIDPYGAWMQPYRALR